MGILTKQLFEIGTFTVLVWHLLVVVAVIILAVVVIALCSRKNKSAKSAVSNQEPAATQQVQQSTEQPVDGTQQTEMQSQPAVEPQQVEQPQEPAVEQPQQPAESPKVTVEPKKPIVKNYHVSLREDGKWQVKLSKGGKAIKLFDTQADAITYAKALAKSQDGRITIHKVDGKIRKQKY